MASEFTKPLKCYSIESLERDAMIKDCNDDVAKRVHDPCSKVVLDDILIALGGDSGTAYHIYNLDVTDVKGTSKDIFTSTVPAATTRSINRILVTTRASGRFDLIIDGTKVGAGRTGPSEMNVVFVFSPVIKVPTGLDIKVSFTMLYGKAGQNVEVTMMGTDVT